MSSSLARSRSLRKPALNPPTSSNPSPGTTVEHTTNNTSDQPRHGSPSRLPVKPVTRSASTATNTSAASSTATSSRIATSASLGRSKPTSVSSLGRSTSTRQTQPPLRKDTASSSTSTTRYPPSTTTTRPSGAVVARPTSSGGPTTQTKRVPTHSRAKSTATASSTSSATSLNANNVLRPPSQGSASRSHHTRAASADKTSAASRSRIAPPAPKAAAAVRQPHLPPPTNRSQPQQSQQQRQPAPRLRPAFSTLQQHYSPAKSAAPKPLTATFLAPPTPSKLPANVAASAEAARLQAELLQLHLTHRDAALVHSEWQASAREKLGRRFSELAAASRAAAEAERATDEATNVQALSNWTGATPLEERVQGLDAVLSGVWTLSEPGGRYARMVRRFERWLDQVAELEEGRREGGTAELGRSSHSQILFIGELETPWKEDHQGFVRKLDGWWRQLQDIGDGPTSRDGGDDTRTEQESRSSLRRMLDGSRSLVHTMLAELAQMEDVEQEALAREDAWVKKMNNDDDDEELPRAGAVWRIM